MPSQRRVGGYVFASQLSDIRASARQIRSTIALINDLLQGGRVSPQAISTLLVEILLKLAQLETAADCIAEIAEEKRKRTPEG